MIKSKNIDPAAGILGTQLASSAALLPAQVTAASATVLVGNSGGVAAAVTLSGDVTNDNAGVTAIGAGKVTNAMILPNALDGTVVKNVAAANVIGGISVVHKFSLANAATGDTDITLTHKTLVYDVKIIKTSTASLNNGANTVQIKSTASAITDAVDIRNIADQTIKTIATVDDSTQTIVAGGILRCSRTKASGSDDNAIDVYVFGYRSA